MSGDDMDIVITGDEDEDCRRDGIKSNSKQGNNNRIRGNDESFNRKMVDITRDKPIKVTIRVAVPVRDHPKFNFVGKLLGPKGNSLKRLQEETMTKMAILGRGSMRDRHKEEELRSSGDARFGHLLDDLHVEITAFAPPAEAHARIAYALSEVRRFLVPDYNDEIRQEQMWEMQILNTSKSSSTNTLNGIGIRNNSNTDIPNGRTAATANGLENGNVPGPGATPPTNGNSLMASSSLITSSSLDNSAFPLNNNNNCKPSCINSNANSLIFNPSSSSNGGLTGQNYPHHNTASNNGSLTPPELSNNHNNSNNNSISSSAMLIPTHPAIRGMKAKSSALSGRKRPLTAAEIVAESVTANGAANGHLFMSPTKRTVLSILARAKAMQNKDPIPPCAPEPVYKHLPGHHPLSGLPTPMHKNGIYPNSANLLFN